MISRKKQRIKILIFGILLLCIASAIVGFSLRDGIEYYKSPTQLLDSKTLSNFKFRLGGLVEGGSISRGGGIEVNFVVTDKVNSVPVVFKGILPDLFSENQGIIALGFYENGVFYAEELLAKHDESYMPKEVIEMLETDGSYVDTTDNSVSE